MIEQISRYLEVIGIIQLVGLNFGGIFWLLWASVSCLTFVVRSEIEFVGF